MKKSLGVCYYPEHWDESLWINDAKQMSDLGLTYVRIGEFAWKRIEPNEGDFHFEWLDKAINILLKQNVPKRELAKALSVVTNMSVNDLYERVKDL